MFGIILLYYNEARLHPIIGHYLGRDTRGDTYSGNIDDGGFRPKLTSNGSLASITEKHSNSQL